jgi:2-C-methyl-D-erythritol 4-phosphate cytidylyltransferase
LIAAVIAAGGTGERFGDADGKQLAEVAGAPILTHTLMAFQDAPSVDAVVVVGHEDRLADYRARALEPFALPKVLAVVPGGPTRQASVAEGVRAVPDGTSVIVIHDGARPLVTAETIERAVRRLEEDAGLAGVVVGHPMYDTVKETDGGGTVVSTPDRSRLWVAQTPQVFRAGILAAALEAAHEDGIETTDDAGLVSQYDGQIEMIEGPRENLKVTVPEDLAVVAALLGDRTRRE